MTGDSTSAKGITPQAWINKKLAEDKEEPDVSSAAVSRRHISEVIRGIMSDVPAEIMASLPKDGASQHDHYIYGLPKREAAPAAYTCGLQDSFGQKKHGARLIPARRAP